MEGVEEEGTLLLPEGASPQNHHRKLKRLKKASEVADLPMRHSPASRPWPEFSRSQDDASEDDELSMEEGQEDSKRKKVASGKRLSKDGKLLESAREKRKLEKESADDFQHCNNEDDKSVDCINEIHDDNGVPSLLGVDLGHNSDASDDSSSEEEDYDKENINPCPDEPVPVNLYRKNDLIKGFVDEEAEEEDDSDHDLMRFQDDENEDEDDDSDEAEVFNGLIASGYKEKPLDAEKRNELHQRWLQHQDAAATDNLLQRLNSHTKQKGPYIVENEADEEEPEEDDSEPLSDPPPVNAARQNARQAKEKMAQMFTDSEDAYISDDEETEQRLLRGNLVLHQTVSQLSFWLSTVSDTTSQVERSSVLSPAEEDETSREVFSLIRKLNTVPDTRRRPSSLPAFISGANNGQPADVISQTRHVRVQIICVWSRRQQQSGL
ncbi:unnamed protein product [Spirodela intermedia]|uniref:Uncharacterized protein n=1 Tax=Spirodela intermedia TaxID=51605 RepID=A0A7I8JB43_SPIIN|nr:unnamed protein product [Spirodela intermedia]CAA6667436.1 unnamed protein product [Spirodela intermedia]